ncbi:hypothetical protein FRB95_012331 [Tulasnella sp. JGI-2019a]|nr:hypothetical protein FRB95_012331 [Tulasnella sp. JGI-2019a]
MDKLPSELIADVLEMVVDTSFTKNLHESPTNDRSRPPLTLSHVNRTIRQIAVATPRIWTYIEVAGIFGTPSSRRDSLQARLARSKACDIDLLVDATNLCPEEITESMTFLSQHVDRWSSITIRGDAAHPVTTTAVTALARVLETAPARRLRFLDTAGMMDRGGSDVQLRVRGADRLVRLSVKQVEVEWSCVSSSLLEDLSLCGLGRMAGSSVVALVNVVRSSPHLLNLRIHNLEMEEDDMAAHGLGTIIDLPVLTSLDLDDVALPVAHHLLTNIDSPMLQHARLSVGGFPQDYDWASLSRSIGAAETVNWCRRKEGAVRRTEVQDARAGVMYEAVIQSAQRATQLSLTHDDMSIRRWIHTAEHGGNGGPIMPALTSLECYDMKGCSIAEIRSLVKLRTASSLSKLEKLSISARDISMTASAGRAMLEAQDEALAGLRRDVAELKIRDQRDMDSFRYTFLGWRDYQSYLRAGRELEYKQEMSD